MNFDWQKPNKYHSKNGDIKNEGELLTARACELAKEIYEKPVGTNVLIFKLAQEYYGIESSYIVRTCETKNITPLITAPPFIEGIINNHRKLVCVIDLKSIFSLAKTPHTKSSRIVILHHEDMELGLLVDEVIKMEAIVLDKIEKSLSTLIGIPTEFLLGITQDQKIILNVAKLIKHKKLIVYEPV